MSYFSTSLLSSFVYREVFICCLASRVVLYLTFAENIVKPESACVEVLVCILLAKHTETMAPKANIEMRKIRML